jgi:phosphopantothenoylcysteine decarboxylase/phosphopantothenate--cysteine ligase
MGVALAAEARRRGARVTLLAANLAVDAPDGVDVVLTPTAEEMAREALARAEADVVVMAAAPADYRPAAARTDKRPKDTSTWTVELEPTTDILETLGMERRDGQVLVGFAADAGETGLERARAKLVRKQANLIVFNDVSRDDVGFDTPENEVVLVTAAAERTVAKAPKSDIAAAILDEVERILRG